MLTSLSRAEQIFQFELLFRLLTQELSADSPSKMRFRKETVRKCYDLMSLKMGSAGMVISPVYSIRIGCLR